MGRGRAKAKQTKVARELKYTSHKTDFEALQRELATDDRPPEDHENGAIDVDEHDEWDPRGR